MKIFFENNSSMVIDTSKAPVLISMTPEECKKLSEAISSAPDNITVFGKHTIEQGYRLTSLFLDKKAQKEPTIKLKEPTPKELLSMMFNGCAVPTCYGRLFSDCSKCKTCMFNLFCLNRTNEDKKPARPQPLQLSPEQATYIKLNADQSSRLISNIFRRGESLCVKVKEGKCYKDILDKFPGKTPKWTYSGKHLNPIALNNYIKDKLSGQGKLDV